MLLGALCCEPRIGIVDDTPHPGNVRTDTEAPGASSSDAPTARAPDRVRPPAAAPRRRQEDADRAARRQRLRRILALVFVVILLCAAVGYGWYYLAVGRYFASTDDAYTEADSTTISPQIAGYISDLSVTDNQRVKRGEILLHIDDRPYKAAVDQSTADVASAKAQIEELGAQIDLQQSQIQQAEADVASAQANLGYAQEDNARYQTLAKTGAGPVQTAQQAATTLRTATATLAHNQATLDAARKQLEVLKTQQRQAEANLQHYQAALEQAQINLGYTTITAPVDGAVGDRSARVGLYVQPGVQLMTIVPMRQDIYVVGNFKETDITDMYRGQKAAITVDAFPDATLHGTVDSLAPGSGSQFSLLPPENATGNFTKIVQRVPVKILLDPRDPDLDRLRPGLSVEVEIDTRTTPAGPKATLVAEGRR
jgi:membrane fusion protein (multidrug efflux system)